MHTSVKEWQTGQVERITTEYEKAFGESSTAGLDSIPPYIDEQSLREMYDRLENVRDSVSVRVLWLGSFDVHFSVLDLGYERPGKKTYVLLGGAVSSIDALKVIGVPLAALGHRVVMTPHVMNGDVCVRSHKCGADFARDYYRLDRALGAFFPDGDVMAEILKVLHEQERLFGKVCLVGMSTGAAVMLRAAEAIMNPKNNMPELLDGLVLISPAGSFPTRVTKGLKRRVEAMRLGSGFLRESTSARFDPIEWLIQIEDAGIPARDFARDGPRLLLRCISSVLHEVASKLRLPITVVCGRQDNAIPYGLLQEAISEVNALRRENCIPDINTIVHNQGNHAWSCQAGAMVAHIMNSVKFHNEVSDI
ncbi:MAG: alpha/beta hydrolase [Patescibacteria group bacterium]|nr:alpha/beta hydrolase [Patescibacteria group bacterium]